MVKLELTELVKPRRARFRNNIARVLNHHLRGFSADDVQQLKHFMMRMLANGSAWQRARALTYTRIPAQAGFFGIISA